MEEFKVNSQIIQSVYFDPRDGRLRICFKNGEERLFADVPKQRVSGLVRAASPGRFYIENIKPHFARLAA